MSGVTGVESTRPAHLWAGVLGGGLLVGIGILDGVVMAEAWSAVLDAREAVASQNLVAGWYGGSGSGGLADGRWPWTGTLVSALLGGGVLIAALYGLVRVIGCAVGLLRCRPAGSGT